MFSSFLFSFGNVLKTLSGVPRRDLATIKANLTNVIVLRTNDVVNADLAQTWCEEHDLVLRVTDQRDELFPAEAGAVVIDLGHLALRSREREALVERLRHALPPYPVAVASYDLDPRAITSLRARGILVFRRIERHLFYQLASAIDRAVAGLVA